jgi:hypothetical protein
LCFICFYLDLIVARACQSVVPSVGDRRVVDICFTLTTSKPRPNSPSAMSFAGGGFVRKVADHCFHGVFGFRVKGAEGQVVVFEMGFHCLESGNILCQNSGPLLVLQNSKICLFTPFRCFCNLMRLVSDVKINGGGLPVLTGTAPLVG